METRDSNGRFLPGSVGNPKGRPRKKPEIPTADNVLDSAAMEAVTRLIDLMHSENEAIALEASLAVIDRTLRKEFVPIPNGVKKVAMTFGNEDIVIDSKFRV